MNNRYEITRALKKDFAGGLYEGTDTLLNRKVACRRFFDTEGDCVHENWEEEFNNYCHKLTSMQHPNLALVYDAGIDEDGAFLVTQRIEGETIEDLLKTSMATEYEVFALAHDILEAFIEIHQQGEVHGALTPQSIIRTKKPGGRYMHYITDLGISSLIPIIQGHPLSLCNPALTAPEQLQGNPPTPQSDLFMLGQLCYTLAAQGHPFSQATDEEAIELHLNRAQKPLGSLAPQIQDPLANWIHDLLSPSPTQRPNSAEEALRKLPTIAPPSTAAPVQKTDYQEQNQVLPPPRSTTIYQTVQSTSNPTLISSTSTTSKPHTALQKAITPRHQRPASLASAKSSSAPIIIISSVGLLSVLVIFLFIRANSTQEEENSLARKSEKTTPNNSNINSNNVVTNPKSPPLNQNDSPKGEGMSFPNTPLRKKPPNSNIDRSIAKTPESPMPPIIKPKQAEKAPPAEKPIVKTEIPEKVEPTPPSTSTPPATSTPSGNTSINIGAPSFITPFQLMAKNPLKVVTLPTNTTKEFIIPLSDKLNEVGGYNQGNCLKKISLSPTSEFKITKAPSLPFSFSYNEKPYRPQMIAATPTGLGIGEGFEIEVKSNQATQLNIDLYYLSWCSNLQCEILESSLDGSNERSLGKRKLLEEEAGFYVSKIQLQNPKNNHSYRIRLTLESITEDNRIALFNISGAILLK